MKNRLTKLYENKKYFEILEIEPTTDLGSINKAFRMLALKYHPDKGGSHDEMVIIVDIMQKLSNKDYLQKYFQCIIAGETFNESHFRFEPTWHTATPHDLRKYMNDIIQSMNDVLEEVMAASPWDDLIESAESPFDVDFHYKHRDGYGEIKIVIREESGNGDYWEQHFQHVFAHDVLIGKVEVMTSFPAKPENLQHKVGKLIQKINAGTSKHTINQALFEELDNWLERQTIDRNKKIPIETGENTRQGQSLKWLRQLSEKQRITPDTFSRVPKIATAALLPFFSPALLASSQDTSVKQSEHSAGHFEIDYYLLSLLTVGSLAILAVLLYNLCRFEKRSISEAVDKDNPSQKPC
ncbi:DnaJ domain-containing protein [Legionella sp. CNM-4043-24]|uniref:DnaJ domain-containing protein n=1 Tax=Legionella sp. CNM-4043-24 TaxID=3421646 RepID=UPI00403B0565